MAMGLGILYLSLDVLMELIKLIALVRNFQRRRICYPAILHGRNQLPPDNQSLTGC